MGLEVHLSKAPQGVRVGGIGRDWQNEDEKSIGNGNESGSGSGGGHKCPAAAVRTKSGS